MDRGMRGGQYTVSTVAGTGISGRLDGRCYTAQFCSPSGVALDWDGNIFATSSNSVRVITVSGDVMTIGCGTAGHLDGNGTDAMFNEPYGIAVDFLGNLLVSDVANHCIRKITPQGVVSTIAGQGGKKGFVDGPSQNARFQSPYDIAVDIYGTIFVADYGNHAIRAIYSQGYVVTIGGNGKAGFADGQGSKTLFSSPSSIALDGASNIYVTDSGNFRIRKITQDGTVSTVAGSIFGFADGQASFSKFGSTSGIAVDVLGNIYIADYSNHKIRMISQTGMVSTIAGTGSGGFSDGLGSTASFNYPYGLAVDFCGNVYVGDCANNRIRKLVPPTPLNYKSPKIVSDKVRQVFFTGSAKQIQQIPQEELYSYALLDVILSTTKFHEGSSEVQRAVKAIECLKKRASPQTEMMHEWLLGELPGWMGFQSLGVACMTGHLKIVSAILDCDPDGSLHGSDTSRCLSCGLSKVCESSSLCRMIIERTAHGTLFLDSCTIDKIACNYPELVLSQDSLASQLTRETLAKLATLYPRVLLSYPSYAIKAPPETFILAIKQHDHDGEFSTELISAGVTVEKPSLLYDALSDVLTSSVVDSLLLARSTVTKESKTTTKPSVTTKTSQIAPTSKTPVNKSAKKTAKSLGTTKSSVPLSTSAPTKTTSSPAKTGTSPTKASSRKQVQHPADTSSSTSCSPLPTEPLSNDKTSKTCTEAPSGASTSTLSSAHTPDQSTVSVYVDGDKTPATLVISSTDTFGSVKSKIEEEILDPGKHVGKMFLEKPRVLIRRPQPTHNFLSLASEVMFATFCIHVTTTN
ncbi:Virginiamycin B lyase [Pelomyxa schiedti]|nr:Virginiamycin B lyase [Pelomyxa schiedti]